MWKHNFMFYCSFFVQQKGNRRCYVLVAVKNQQGSVYLVGEQPAEKKTNRQSPPPHLRLPLPSASSCPGRMESGSTVALGGETIRRSTCTGSLSRLTRLSRLSSSRTANRHETTKPLGPEKSSGTLAQQLIA